MNPESFMTNFRLTDPPEGFAQKVLAPARALSARDWSERLWASRHFWLSAAAVLLICLLVHTTGRPGPEPRQPASQTQIILPDRTEENNFLELYLNQQTAFGFIAGKGPSILEWRNKLCQNGDID